MAFSRFQQNADTVTVAATTASASATLPANSNLVRVYNAGASLVYIRFGVPTLVATTTDMPVPSGTIETFVKGGANTVAVIAAASATVYFTPGESA